MNTPPNFGAQRFFEYAKRSCDSVYPESVKPELKNTFTVRGFTPVRFTKIASLLKTPNNTVKKITTDEALLVIPTNAIIDKISFFGYDNFSTSGFFTIGLGQLNNNILVPLIEEATAEIANERVGGCRDFAALNSNGKNTKSLVLVNSHVNIAIEEPITTGYLLVEITYHIKPCFNK